MRGGLNTIIGAIIGDIVGSVYEWDRIKTKNFPLFSPNGSFTDDTVMTCAVASAFLQGRPKDAEEFKVELVRQIQYFGRKYPGRGYGGLFADWLISPDPKPYNSFGNGSAMRVSPAAWAARTLNEAENFAELTASVTHNHPEGIRGAKATAAAIFMARMKESKSEIKSYIERTYGYDLGISLKALRPTYYFNESCQMTVPPAIISFLESTRFQDAIRNAVSLGGDSDTLAAITGSIAEAYYRIPNAVVSKAYEYLDEDLKNLYLKFRDRYVKPKGGSTAKAKRDITASVKCITQDYIHFDDGINYIRKEDVPKLSNELLSKVEDIYCCSEPAGLPPALYFSINSTKTARVYLRVLVQ